MVASFASVLNLSLCLLVPLRLLHMPPCAFALAKGKSKEGLYLSYF